MHFGTVLTFFQITFWFFTKFFRKNFFFLTSAFQLCLLTTGLRMGRRLARLRKDPGNRRPPRLEKEHIPAHQSTPSRGLQSTAQTRLLQGSRCHVWPGKRHSHPRQRLFQRAQCSVLGLEESFSRFFTDAFP